MFIGVPNFNAGDERPHQVQEYAFETDTDLEIIAVSESQSPASTVSIEQNKIRYLLEDGFSGTDSFTYTISDGYGGFDTTNVNISIIVVNDPPIAVADSFTVTQQATVRIDVLNNDSDADGDELSLIGVSSPSNGSASITSDNNFILYLPNVDFEGNDSFVYQLSDNRGGTSTALVTISVEFINNKPVLKYVRDLNNQEISSYDALQDTPFLQTVLILEDDDEADLANLDFYFDGTNGSKAMKVTSSSLAIARLSTSNNSEMLINGKASLKIDLFGFLITQLFLTFQTIISLLLLLMV